MFFPFLFPRYSESKEELCEVIHICAGRRGGDEIDIEYSTFIVTVQDRSGARGKINLGLIYSWSPWRTLQVGSTILASVKAKKLFPLEMKILELKEIAFEDSDRLVARAA